MMFFPRHAFALVVLVFGALAGLSIGGEPLPPPKTPFGPPVVTCVADLRKLSPLQLEYLFTHLQAGPQPVGFARGEILHLANTCLPCWKAKMAGKIWKGKVFCESGDFVNQWRHFQAIRSRAYYGPSYIDGLPCMILEYDDKTPFFKNMRDEVREICPGLYLSMVFDRGGCHTFRGVIALELQCDKK